MVGALSKVIWPIAILVYFTTGMGFFPMILIAIVANIVLRAVKTNLRQRRYAALPPAPPTYPPAPNDLR